MDQNTVDELLKLIGDAFYQWNEGKAHAIYEWMQKNAPQHLKN